MNKDNVNAVLDALAARLSVPATHLWQVLLRQAAVEFWVSLIGSLLALAVLSVFVYWAAKIGRREGGWEEGSIEKILVFACGTASLVVFIASLVTTWGSVAGLMNPEYYALKEIFGALK